ncbi:hypothetical protein IEQ34_013413 [Dendrobium chrysotoxum]|uniref:Uncharacterized protein n=1 Tax=Dendrobium chrysotoxum TaxID=161865 RepID=A0AAV7GQY9_DENCH|nr:hypothetical protein IEQ34_013413 [Dendrobium chrysotoxum]
MSTFFALASAIAATAEAQAVALGDAVEDGGFLEYIPVKKRRAMEAQKILQRKGLSFFSSAAGAPSSFDDPTTSLPPP